MSDIVRHANKVQVRAIKNCTGSVEHETCEFLIYLSVPKAGGDGMLLGVVESEQAAETIASALNQLFSSIHNHVD